MQESAETGNVNTNFRRFENGLELKMGEDLMVFIPKAGKRKPFVYKSMPNSKNKWKRKIDRNPDILSLGEFAKVAAEQLPEDEFTKELVKIYENKKAENNNKTS